MCWRIGGTISSDISSPGSRLSGNTPARVFSSADRREFAELSGDYNPVHVDALSARRTLFGSPVAHGVHSVLWALDAFLQGDAEPCRLRSLKARFPAPIPGETEVLAVGEAKDRHLRLQVTVEDRPAVVVEADYDPLDSPVMDGVADRAPAASSPRALTAAEMSDARGEVELVLHRELAARLFPVLTRRLPVRQLATILATTRIVGMECPGLHSIYSSLDLEFQPDFGGGDSLGYKVRRFNERLSLVEIALIAQGAKGLIRAFLRPATQVQLRYADVDEVVAGEFAGIRGLIVGGSRGLGEVAAKLLAAGGADVRLTYGQGRAEAEAIVDEINAGKGQAGCLAWDVLDPPKDLRACLGETWRPTHLLYFATPHIGSRGGAAFSTARFGDFCAFYVEGLVRTLDALQEGIARPLRVFYPSTVFVEKTPQGMGEYAAAKAAGEAVCRDMEGNRPGVKPFVVRLPRLATDQTRSLIDSQAPAPAPRLLAELRRFLA